MTYNIDRLRDLRDRLLAKQKELQPALTFSLIKDTLHYEGNGGAQNMIEQLLKAGMLREVDLGNRKGYVVVE